MLQQSASGLGIDQNLQRYRAVSLRQHGFLVGITVDVVNLYNICNVFVVFIIICICESTLDVHVAAAATSAELASSLDFVIIMSMTYPLMLNMTSY